MNLWSMFLDWVSYKLVFELFWWAVRELTTTQPYSPRTIDFEMVCWKISLVTMSVSVHAEVDAPTSEWLANEKTASAQSGFQDCLYQVRRWAGHLLKLLILNNNTRIKVKCVSVCVVESVKVNTFSWDLTRMWAGHLPKPVVLDRRCKTLRLQPKTLKFRSNL